MATNQLREIRRTRRLTPEEAVKYRAIRRKVYAEFPSLRMTKYRDLERKLLRLRRDGEGHGSAEEDAVLEEMDRVWSKLTIEEREVLDHESPKCLVSRGIDSKTS